MRNSEGPIIDMNRNGEFVDPPKPSLGMIVARVAAFGVLLLAAAVALWAAMFIVPVLLVLGAAGYFFFRHQLRGRSFVIMRRF